MTTLTHGMTLGKAKVFVDIIPAKNVNTRPGRRMNPVAVTYHNTGSPGRGGDAKAHNTYIHRLANAEPGTLKDSKSWHFTVDDGAIYQHIPLNENAWHCGDGVGTKSGNMTSIGIEICMHSDQKDYHQAEENAIALGVHLAKMFNIPDANHVPHQHWSGKYCPSVILSRDGGFKKFHKRIMDALKSGGAPVAPQPTPAPTPQPTPVVEPPKGSPIGKATIIVDALNVRADASFTAPVVALKRRGEVEEVYETKNGLHRVKEGWMSAHAAYVSYAPIVKSPEGASIGKATILVDALNVRAQNNFTAPVVLLARRGQKFDVFETKNGMYRVKSGWMSASTSYVKFEPVKVEAPAPKPIAYAVIRVAVLNVRAQAVANSAIVTTVLKGQRFPIYETRNGMHKIGEGKWISAGTAYTTLEVTNKPSIVKGSMVKVAPNAKSYTGATVSSFVYRGTYKVDEISGNRALLDKMGICTPFDVKDLILVSGGSLSSSPDPAPVPPTGPVVKGSKVRVNKNARTYTGGTVSPFVYSSVYTVDELSGDRALLDAKGICTPFKVKDLTLAQ